jgi:hypothetical protein
MKHTLGGRFDPTEPFPYFLAGSPERWARNDQYPYPYVLVAVNECLTAKKRHSSTKP